MPTPINQLLSRTLYATDGSTTEWDFSFSGGYISKSHVKALIEAPSGERTELVVTEGMLTGPFTLRIYPALPAGYTLTVYRDTPKDLPLVDFTDESGFSEVSLDTSAKQAVFIAAETVDTVNTSSSYDAEQAASQAATSASLADASADAAALAALSATNSANAATVSANASLAASEAAAASAEAAADEVTEFVSALAAPSGASLVGYLPAGVGAVATTVQAMLRKSLSINDYGAVAGAADNTAAINACALAAKSYIGSRYITASPGDYYCAGELTELNDVLILGSRAKITSPVANNYYARIYDQAQQPAAPSINPQLNKAGLSKFYDALNRHRNGGTAPVVVFVGDSLTQGGHRTGDNWFWVQKFKAKMTEIYGFEMNFKNRGIAGSGVSSVLLPVGATPINAPYEANWVTSTSATWLSYIEALLPDLIVVAFGMNSGSASESGDIVATRNALKAISSAPSLVWLTTPIRTTDLTASNSGTLFGTYPGNQYSNNAGYMTRLIADFYGDPVIDVNRMSNIVQLGMDPIDFAIERWAGQYRDNTLKFTSTAPITVNGDGTLDLNCAGTNSYTTNEMFREVVVEFSIDAGATLSPLRVGLRQDPGSQSAVIIQFSAASIDVYYTSFTLGSFGLRHSYVTSPTAGNRYRIELIGKRLTIYVSNGGAYALVGTTSDVMGSTFLAPVVLKGLNTTNAILRNVNISGAARGNYKQYVPRLTAAEVFAVGYGDGGNGLNHPNVRGEAEMYDQPIEQFLHDLKSTDLESSQKSGALTLNAAITSGAATYTIRDGKYVCITFIDMVASAGLALNSLLMTVPAEIRPASAVFGVLFPYAYGTTIGFDVRPNGASYLALDMAVGGTYKGTLTYVL